MKTIKLIFFVTFLALLSGCQKYDNLNPNLPGENSTVAPSALLNRIEFEISKGIGMVDGQSTAVNELPFTQELSHYNQYFISNDTYYGGFNDYSEHWSNTAHPYEILANIEQMEKSAYNISHTSQSAYAIMARFFRAYIFIWYSERVGDIPMSEAGQGLTNQTPKYDSQHDVYKACLQLLDSCNIIINANKSTNGAAALIVLPFNGDMFGFNLIQWQKVINAYELRVLMSLSKKVGVGDAADLNIVQRFDTIVSHPDLLPASNKDNLVFKYVASTNPYGVTSTNSYNVKQPVCSTLLSLTDSTKDPRTFIFASPSKYQINTLKKSVGDFTAYVGLRIDSSYSYLKGVSSSYQCSFANYSRYYNSSLTGPTTGDEANGSILIGYPEMCFNIAEGINRGWLTSGNASTWYTNGIKASMSYFGIADGASYTVCDETGKPIGPVTFAVNTFLAGPQITYSTDQATALNQILTQKYIALWENSGWQAFYNWRRTGIPTTFVTNSSLFNGKGQVPIRWNYPTSETTYNAANCNAAIQSQFDGPDDIFQKMWILK